jgi:hypothetical protein
MTYDGSNVLSYVNGVQCGISAVSGATFTTPYGIWSVGQVSSTAMVDDIRVYNRVLSATELLELYNAEK